MHGNPEISVVIPTHNYGRFITEAVQSVLDQRLPDGQPFTGCEIIVVDDGSTDDTKERLAPFLARIRYIYQENQGPSAARNAGIRAARGQYIAFLDSDDLWLPNMLASLLPILQRDPHAGLVASLASYAHFPHDTAPDSSLSPTFSSLSPPPLTPIPASDLVVISRFGTCGVLIRRECFDTCGLFDENLRGAEDRDMWIRIALRYPIYRLELPLWENRIHSDSASFNVPRMKANQELLLRKTFAYAEFRRRLFLRLRAWSLLYYDVACSLRESQHHTLRAMMYILLSMVVCPGPFGSFTHGVRFIRSRTLLRLLLGKRIFQWLSALAHRRHLSHLSQPVHSEDTLG